MTQYLIFCAFGYGRVPLPKVATLTQGPRAHPFPYTAEYNEECEGEGVSYRDIAVK